MCMVSCHILDVLSVFPLNSSEKGEVGGGSSYFYQLDKNRGGNNEGINNNICV